MAGRFANLELYDQHDHAETVPLTAAQHSEPTQNVLMARAREERQWARFESALRLYTRALRQDRKLIAAWVGQVQMLVELNECHEARTWSDKGLELFRGNGDLLAAKAQAAIRLNDRQLASECSDASLAAPGTSVWRWIARGELQLGLRQRFSSECFQKAIAEPLSDWFDHVIIARIYHHYDQITNALHHLTRALEQEATHASIWFEMGNCQRDLGLSAAAVQSYQRCLELRNDFAPANDALRAMSSGSVLRMFRRILGRGKRR